MEWSDTGLGPLYQERGPQYPNGMAIEVQNGLLTYSRISIDLSRPGNPGMKIHQKLCFPWKNWPTIYFSEIHWMFPQTCRKQSTEGVRVLKIYRLSQIILCKSGRRRSTVDWQALSLGRPNFPFSWKAQNLSNCKPCNPCRGHVVWEPFNIKPLSLEKAIQPQNQPFIFPDISSIGMSLLKKAL